MNQVILMGNLTRDPELRDAGSSQVAKFTLANNRRWKNAAGEQQEEVSFIDCEIWGRRAEVLNQYVSKGQRLLVRGEIRQDRWEDNEGNNRSKLYVAVEDFDFIEKAGTKAQETVGAGAGDDDIPF